MTMIPVNYELKHNRKENFKSSFETSISDININQISTNPHLTTDFSSKFEQNQYQSTKALLCTTHSSYLNDQNSSVYNESQESMKQEKKFVSELHINIRDPGSNNAKATNNSFETVADNESQNYENNNKVHYAKFETYINNNDKIGPYGSLYSESSKSVASTSSSSSEQEYVQCFDENVSNCRKEFHSEKFIYLGGGDCHKDNDECDKPMDLVEICGDQINNENDSCSVKPYGNINNTDLVIESAEETKQIPVNNKNCSYTNESQSQSSYSTIQYSVKSVQTSKKFDCLLKDFCDKSIITDEYKELQNTQNFCRKPKEQTINSSPSNSTSRSGESVVSYSGNRSLSIQINDPNQPKQHNIEKPRKRQSCKPMTQDLPQHHLNKNVYPYNEVHEESNQDTYAESYSDTCHDQHRQHQTKQDKTGRSTKTRPNPPTKKKVFTKHYKKKKNDSLKSFSIEQKQNNRRRRQRNQPETKDSTFDERNEEYENLPTELQQNTPPKLEKPDIGMNHSYEIQCLLDNLNSHLLKTARSNGRTLTNKHPSAAVPNPQSKTTGTMNKRDIQHPNRPMKPSNSNQVATGSFWDNPLNNDTFLNGLSGTHKANNNGNSYLNNKSGSASKLNHISGPADICSNGNTMQKQQHKLPQASLQPNHKKINPEIQAIFDSIEMNQYNYENQQNSTKPTKLEQTNSRNNYGSYSKMASDSKRLPNEVYSSHESLHNNNHFNNFHKTNTISNPLNTSNLTTNNNTTQQQSSCQLSHNFDARFPNNLKYQRNFELSPYDELIKSHLSPSDRRIKSVAAKNGCQIAIDGPINLTDPTSTCQAIRSKVAYKCIVASQSKDRLDKCLNYLKETFPNTCIRLHGRNVSNCK